MNFLLDKTHFSDIDAAESGCVLLTNGLGGYVSLNCAGGTSRNDHSIFMAAVKAPNVRYNMVTNILAVLSVDGKKYDLCTQRMADGTFRNGFCHIDNITYGSNLVSWCFHAEDVEVSYMIVMPHGENTVMIYYHIYNPVLHKVELELTPLLRFTPKNEPLKPDAHFSIKEQKLSCASSDKSAMSSYMIENNGLNLLTATDGTVSVFEPVVYGPFKWSLDTRDGRNDTGIGIANHRIIRCTSDFDSEVTVLYSLEPADKISKKTACGLTKAFEQAVQAEEARINALTDVSPLKSSLGKQLTISADAFIVDRESTGGKTIIAGYPFFEDWGRDTMIALGGTTLAAGRFSECKSILRTFAKYEKNGLLPNLFPEGGMTPMYNSADAPLLFVNAVYEYIKFSKDEEFLQECFAPMKEIMDAYENGTDFHIKCDSDGLIMAGDDLEQLTWMDVRVGDYLPTPRHGKPVEINAYWYSALCCMHEFCLKKASVSEASAERGNAEETAAYYTSLADKYAAMSERTRESFLAKYPDSALGCLKDVLNGTYEENQIRCNQIWALTQPFTMLNNALREEILDTVERELYTTAGLRTLSMKDENFHAVYIGDMVSRDSAYHQGTVWTFPLGAYLRARIMQLPHYNAARRQAECEKLERAFEALKGWLFEGCLGQLAEIYDGKEPNVSRGCYAQAWSVGEILRAVYDWENYQTRCE